jgi:hypothetical protein
LLFAVLLTGLLLTAFLCFCFHFVFLFFLLTLRFYDGLDGH